MQGGMVATSVPEFGSIRFTQSSLIDLSEKGRLGHWALMEV